MDDEVMHQLDFDNLSDSGDDELLPLHGLTSGLDIEEDNCEDKSYTGMCASHLNMVHNRYTPFVTSSPKRGRTLLFPPSLMVQEKWSQCKEKVQFSTFGDQQEDSPIVYNKADFKSSKECSSSPPYKLVKNLQLKDVPTTPHTLLTRSMYPLVKRSSLGTDSGFLEKDWSDDNSYMTGSTQLRPRAYVSRIRKPPSNRPVANINPFTPKGMILAGKKRGRDLESFDSSVSDVSGSSVDICTGDEDTGQATKKLLISEANVSRFHEEFITLGQIGLGEFGFVYKCINRLDGCIYALKKSRKPVAGSVQEKIALNEVYAHAVLGKHQNIVRYYSAWAEDNHMIIQNEFCNGGSLADMINSYKTSRAHFPETELRKIVIHVARGLRYIHSFNLCHLDIKPGNIFITRKVETPASLGSSQDSLDDGFDDEATDEDTVYKIGDFGHVMSLLEPHVEEGDCRYLPQELLQDDFGHLIKADIFALGLTVYEAAGYGPLPKNGENWHTIRSGKLKRFNGYSEELHRLLELMVAPDPVQRPTASSLLDHTYICPMAEMSKLQLRRELNTERLKNDLLTRQLMEAAQCLSTIGPSLLASSAKTKCRLVGRSCSRSKSATIF